jgi:uncharacterized protein HemY
MALEASDAAAARDALREAAVVAGEEDLLPKLILIERLLELGEFDEAERHLTFVLHYEPQHPRGNLDRARLLFARGDATGCLEPLERAAADRRTRQAAQQLSAQCIVGWE